MQAQLRFRNGQLSRPRAAAILSPLVAQVEIALSSGLACKVRTFAVLQLLADLFFHFLPLVEAALPGALGWSGKPLGPNNRHCRSWHSPRAMRQQPRKAQAEIQPIP
jgi:hypothetical protein